MTDLHKIPATVITGFLGAGKTTLIRHLLENAGDKRIALIINEFGDLGFDKEILTGCGLAGCAQADVIELANGCICCTVADDFLPSIEKLLERDEKPDHIVIETSGLALPEPLIKALNWPEIRSRVTLDGVVTVLDAPAVKAGLFAHDPAAVQAQRAADQALDHDSPLKELFDEQLGSADMVLINKADLLTEDALAGVVETIRRQIKRDAVKIVTTRYGKLDPSIMLGLEAVQDLQPSHHNGDHAHDHDHDHDAFETFSVTLDETPDPDAVQAVLTELADTHNILRVKGILHIPGKAMRQVIQGVGGRFQRYFDRPWNGSDIRATQLVIIGLHGLDQAAIRARLNAA